MNPGAVVGIVVAVLIFAIIVLILVTRIRVVRQTDKYVVERLGKYLTTWSTGIHFLAPFVDKVVKKVSMKEQIYDFPPQPVITKDNVTMQIDTIVFFNITDPKLYTYGVEDPIVGIESLTATTLRNIIGDLDLDATLTSRDIINAKMRNILDEATDPWGIKVTRVEVKNILPPRDIQAAMEKQMRAEREKREKILIAEGEKTSAITIAEGNKESAILNAEAEKQSLIKKAEAQAESILKVKKAEAEGELMVRQAEAESIRLLNEANPSQGVLAIRSFEAMAKVADGNATKLIVPSNLQDFASYAASFTETVEAMKKDGARKPAKATPVQDVKKDMQSIEERSKKGFEESEKDVHSEMAEDHPHK